MLGGVPVPFARGLAGHSDGDVASHALADAVLGAALGETLGDHFPSSDERWRDMGGVALLERVAALTRARGWAVQSAHVVIMAEAPPLQPHLAAMGYALSTALAAPSAVTVGATSTDGLGLVGRGEGIAASAVALVGSIS